LRFKVRTTLLAAGVLAALAALVVIPRSNALADGSQCSKPPGTCAGRVTFQSSTQTFKIFDQKPDRHSAVVVYWLPDGSGPYFGWNSGGNGTQTSVTLHLLRGDWVFYKACLGESGPKTLVADTCGAGVTDFV